MLTRSLTLAGKHGTQITAVKFLWRRQDFRR